LFLVSAASAAPVAYDQAEMAALRAAGPIWGSLNTLSGSPLYAPDGTISAYAFTFGRNGTLNLNTSAILAGYNLRQAGQVTQGWDLARDPQNYAYVIVAGDDQHGPILEMCDGLPAHLIFQYDVEAMGAAALSGSVQIVNNFYLHPLENWYEVSNGSASVMVNPRRNMTVTPAVFTDFGSLYDFPGNPTAPEYWTLLLTTTPVGGADDEGYIAGVPNYNQTDTDCGPHSSAQAVGYWDNHTYQTQGPWPLLIDNDFWGLRDEMRSAMGWQSGSGVTVAEINAGIETVCNSSSYNNNYDFDAVTHMPLSYANCTAAVNGGRTSVICTFNHPVYDDHAMTLVGFNDTPSQMVQVHDNWPPDTDEPMLAFTAAFDALVDIFPAGGGPATPIALSSFTGEYRGGAVELSWVTASELDCYGFHVLRSDGRQVNAEMIPAQGGAAQTRTYTLTDDAIQAGRTYTYTLQTLFVDGRSENSATVEVRTLVHDLAQNSPNPFNASTSIRYTVPDAGFVTLTVYDIHGREVATLVQGYQAADAYSVNFDASSLSSGLYLYRLQVGDYTAMKKMALLK